jgi:hypothetical protein
LSYFTNDWKALAGDKWGEATHARISIRTIGASPETIVITETETALAVSVVNRRRDRKFGTVQAQNWQFELTNATLAMMADDIAGGAVQLECGFLDADEWAVCAVGRIFETEASISGLISVDVIDAIQEFLDARLVRDIYFRDTAWSGEVQDELRSDTSSGYNNSLAPLGVGTVPFGAWQSLCVDYTFTIEFTSATAFKIVLENGNEVQTGVITADLNIYGQQVPAPTFEFITLSKLGWDLDTNAYVAGDKFVFFSALARTQTQLGGGALLADLLNIPALQVYDFPTAAWTALLHEPLGWNAGLFIPTSGDKFGGFHARGSRLIDLAQGIMRIIQVSLYTMPNGRIFYWYLTPAEVIGQTLSTDPDADGPVILGGSVKTGILETYNSIIYRYKNLVDGSDAVAKIKDPNTPFDAEMVLDFTIPWEVRAVSVTVAVGRVLARFQNPNKVYNLETTFGGAGVDIGEIVTITAPAIGLSNVQASVISVGLDPLNDRALIEATVEEIVLEDRAKVGFTHKIGGVADADTGKVW